MVELRLKAADVCAPSAAGDLDETSEEFWTAVRALPHRQAQAAALRSVYDQPIADVARTLGCSDGTVGQHLSRARTSLAATLGMESTEDLARSATDELLERSAPDVGRGPCGPEAHPAPEERPGGGFRRHGHGGRRGGVGGPVPRPWRAEPVERIVRNGALVVVSGRYLLIRGSRARRS